MKRETEEMINKSSLKGPDGKNIVHIVHGDFNVDGSKIILTKILLLSINGVDIYDVDSEDIYNDNLRIFFDKPLPEYEDKYTYKELEYDKESMELHINGEVYIVRDYSDFNYFVSDFNGNVKDTVNSVIETFIHWLMKYNK